MAISIDTTRSRLPMLVSIAIGVASLVVGWFLIGRGPTHSSAFGGLANAINQETARLIVKPRTIELTSEKAMRVRNAIKSEDYSTATTIASNVLSQSQLQNWRFYPFAYFINDIADVNDPAFEKNLNAWVTQNKGDALPLLIRAKYYHDLGWLKRGGKFDHETQSSHLDSFTNYMNKALTDIGAAIYLNDGNPYGFYLKLKIMSGFGLSDALRNAFDEAIAKFPTYYPLYDIMLSALEPKWGGNVPAMYAFVDQYAGHAEDSLSLKLLYLSLYRDLLNTASVACMSYKSDKDKMAQCVASVMQQIVRSNLEYLVVEALQVYDHSDKYQFGVVVGEILSDMLRTAGGDVYSGAILQLAASSMHSDTQLKEDKPGGNNYVIDRAVSQSWFLKGFYDNSLKKDLESLQNVETTAFPNEEEKDLAVGSIYEYIAGSYDQLHQYADMIAYEKAAIAVGGQTRYEHLICYGYFRLKDYDDAVATCTKAIEHVPGNVKALYWRGNAYRDLGQTEAAVRDLTTVADSEDDFRTSAAIDLSMIYFNRGDDRSALDLLNKYKYLYDPDATSKVDMAVAYNNRCYAFMQLGQLKEALDDCRASLKYGSIPDAYCKLQQLVKRLGAHETGL